MGGTFGGGRQASQVIAPGPALQGQEHRFLGCQETRVTWVNEDPQHGGKLRIFQRHTQSAFGLGLEGQGN
jgi:hypothetical protein